MMSAEDGVLKIFLMGMEFGADAIRVQITQ
jgi:hypothetical protein